MFVIIVAVRRMIDVVNSDEGVNAATVVVIVIINGMGRNGMEWHGLECYEVGWDGVGRDRVGWDGVERLGVAWDTGGWDGIEWDVM